MNNQINSLKKQDIKPVIMDKKKITTDFFRQVNPPNVLPRKIPPYQLTPSGPVFNTYPEQQQGMYMPANYQPYQYMQLAHMPNQMLGHDIRNTYAYPNQSPMMMPQNMYMYSMPMQNKPFNSTMPTYSYQAPPKVNTPTEVFSKMNSPTEPFLKQYTQQEPKKTPTPKIQKKRKNKAFLYKGRYVCVICAEKGGMLMSSDAESIDEHGPKIFDQHLNLLPEKTTIPYSFSTSGHLTRHLRLHSGVKDHICPEKSCGKRFGRRDNMRQHYKIHLKK